MEPDQQLLGRTDHTMHQKNGQHLSGILLHTSPLLPFANSLELKTFQYLFLEINDSDICPVCSAQNADYIQQQEQQQQQQKTIHHKRACEGTSQSRN